MRDYGKVSPKFWIGATGKMLRRAGHEAQLVGLYLQTGTLASMLGLYYLPMTTLSHETGLGLEGASKGLARCIEAGFCAYDEASEMVWVYEMAKYQIADQLAANDNRCKGIQREYDDLPENPYLEAYFDKYKDIFHLTRRRSNSSESPPEPQAPPKPLASQEHEQEQEEEQEQEQETDLSALPTDVRRGTDLRGQIAARVFGHWCQTWGHPRAKLDRKRRTVIRAALDMGYSEGDLNDCISGYRNSPYHMGRNESHTVYDNIATFLRDGAHIDRGIAFHRSPPRTDLSPKTLQAIDQTAGWVPPEMRHAAG